MPDFHLHFTNEGEVYLTPHTERGSAWFAGYKRRLTFCRDFDVATFEIPLEEADSLIDAAQEDGYEVSARREDRTEV
jgi:hypothetical protein